MSSFHQRHVTLITSLLAVFLFLFASSLPHFFSRAREHTTNATAQTLEHLEKIRHQIVQQSEKISQQGILESLPTIPLPEVPNSIDDLQNSVADLHSKLYSLSEKPLSEYSLPEINFNLPDLSIPTDLPYLPSFIPHDWLSIFNSHPLHPKNLPDFSDIHNTWQSYLTFDHLEDLFYRWLRLDYYLKFFDINQTVNFISFLWALYFVKRIFEAFSIQFWGPATPGSVKVPFSTLLVESVFYSLFAVAISAQVTTKWSTSTIHQMDIMFWISAMLFVIGMFGNFLVVVQLQQFETHSGRSLPTGPFFQFVTFPHYSFEMLTWLAFALMTRTFFASILCVSVFLILSSKASFYHSRYCRDFRGQRSDVPVYDGNRPFFIPFLY